MTQYNIATTWKELCEN